MHLKTMTLRPRRSLTIATLLTSLLTSAFVPTAQAAETDTRFDILRFQVDGNSLLPKEQVSPKPRSAKSSSTATSTSISPISA